MLKIGKYDKLRIVIGNIIRSGGLPKTIVYDLIDILEEKYYNSWRYRIELTPRTLGRVLSEFSTIKRFYGLTNNNRRLRPIYYTINKRRKSKCDKKEIPPLISDGMVKMVHKCKWKKYLIVPDGRFKVCKICGLILHDEDAEPLDILVSKK